MSREQQRPIIQEPVDAEEQIILKAKIYKKIRDALHLLTRVSELDVKENRNECQIGIYTIRLTDSGINITTLVEGTSSAEVMPVTLLRTEEASDVESGEESAASVGDQSDSESADDLLDRSKNINRSIENERHEEYFHEDGEVGDLLNTFVYGDCTTLPLKRRMAPFREPLKDIARTRSAIGLLEEGMMKLYRKKQLLANLDGHNQDKEENDYTIISTKYCRVLRALGCMYNGRLLFPWLHMLKFAAMQTLDNFVCCDHKFKELYYNINSIVKLIHPLEMHLIDERRHHLEIFLCRKYCKMDSEYLETELDLKLVERQIGKKTADLLIGHKTPVKAAPKC